MRLSWVPEFLKKELLLRRARRAHPSAVYIRSHLVSPAAQLGLRVGIGEGVLVNGGVSIGDHTYINAQAMIFSGSIGKFCSIAHGVQIGAENHPTAHLSTSPSLYGEHSVAGVTVHPDEKALSTEIGNDVWLGSRAIIQQGVRVGNGAIVAAGAVVTRDVEPFSIVAGVPAKFSRYRFSQSHIDLIESNPWWDFPAERLVDLRPASEAEVRWPSHYPDALPPT